MNLPGLNVLSWADKKLNEPKLLTWDVDFMVSEDYLFIFFMRLWEQITHRCGGGQFEPQGYRLQRVGWIYILNHYALLHTKYKSYWNQGFRRFFNFFPIIRKLITDPHGITKLNPKGTVGTIYAGDHKTLLYTKI